jgi:hypothetical protein
MNRERALVAAALALLLVLFVNDGVRVYRKTERPESKNDFELLWEGGRRVLDGEDVYAVEGAGYVYAPPAYLVFALLGVAPLGVSVVLWHLAKTLLFALTAITLWRLLVRVGFERVAPAMALTALGVARALDSDLQLGQCNLVVCALVVAVAWAYVTRRDAAAGLLVAAAMLFKVTPGLFLVYFAWKRRWRLVAWVAVGGVLLGLLLPAAVFGPARLAEMYGVFVARMIAPSVDGEPITGRDGFAPGQSLPPVMSRWLTPTQAVSPGRVDEVVTINVVSLSPGAARAASKLVCALLIALLLAVCRPGVGDSRSSRRTLLELGLVATVMLLVSPYARKAHHVTLAMAFAPAAAYALDERRRDLGVVVALAALVTGLTSPGVLGRELSQYATACGPFALAGLLLAAAAAVAVRCERARERQRPATAPADAPGE